MYNSGAGAIANVGSSNPQHAGMPYLKQNMPWSQFVPGSLEQSAEDELKEKLSKISVNRATVENTESELDVKGLKVKGKDEFKADTVNGLPIDKISKFTDKLIKTKFYFLPEKDQMDIKNHLNSMSLVGETKPVFERVNYCSEQWKSFVGYLCAKRDKGGKTISVAYCFNKLEFKLKSSVSRFSTLKTSKGKKLTPRQIQEFRTEYTRLKFLKTCKSNGLLDKVNYDDWWVKVTVLEWIY